MKNKAFKEHKIIFVGIALIALSIVISIFLNSNIFINTNFEKMPPPLSEEELNAIYAPIIENNRKMLERTMDYGDEFCSAYVSTSDSLSLHTEILNEIQRLSDEICEDCETDYEKVKAIAYWVAGNICYNQTAAETSVNPDTISLETTLKTKATTCAGYSNMFSAMCNMQGIYCVNLRGGTVGKCTSSEYLENIPMNHEWNAVIIDGEWVFVDTTWLSNNIYLEEEGYQKYESFDDQYFDMSFEYMSYEHRIDLNDYRDFKSSVNALK